MASQSTSYLSDPPAVIQTDCQTNDEAEDYDCGDDDGNHKGDVSGRGLRGLDDLLLLVLYEGDEAEMRARAACVREIRLQQAAAPGGEKVRFPVRALPVLLQRV